MTTRGRACCASTALALLGCSEPGTLTLTSTLSGAACVEDAAVIVYAIPDAVCGEITCGAYFDACDEGCVVACPTGCAVDDLTDAVALAPPPGRYAIVIDYIAGDGDVLGTACTQATIEADGTSSAALVADGVCCAR